MFENRNYAFAGAFVDELARSGLHHVCICPGSRSSPLAISFARHPEIKKWVHLDERSAAFFALGIAKALGEPVAVVCTSGTAAANLHPAVIEAHYSFIPLILLTSDRPPELVEWGANQTIQQSRIFGVHAKWAVDVAPPEATSSLLRYVRVLACRVLATAGGRPAGPVHVNFPFRDPLAPEDVPQDFPLTSEQKDREAWQGRSDGSPFLRASEGTVSPDPAVIRSLASELGRVERGILVCGPQSCRSFADAVASLARSLGYPLLADPLSQARCGPHDASLVIDNYDLFLRDEELAARLAPQVVLRFGATPTSKPLNRYLERHKNVRHLLVGDLGWHDASHLASGVIRSDATSFCRELTSAVELGPRTSTWLEEWCALHLRTRQAIETTLGEMEELFEGKVFREVAALLPEGATLFAGNSMPVRDMDAFLPVASNRVRCMGNRGASGIDGVVSTAMGASAVLEGPVVLVLGDLSLYHDMNGLFAAKRHNLHATIIVINNDGGGVFSFLPQARYPEFFEEYLGTPHGLEFRSAAEMYGLDYAKVDSWGELREAASRSISSSGTAIIEVPGDRARNVELHHRVWSAVSEALRADVKG